MAGTRFVRVKAAISFDCPGPLDPWTGMLGQSPLGLSNAHTPPIRSLRSNQIKRHTAVLHAASGRRSLNQHHRRRRQSLDRATLATQLAIDVSTVDQQNQLVRKFVGVVHTQT
jgi:hypothetical protein